VAKISSSGLPLDNRLQDSQLLFLGLQYWQERLAMSATFAFLVYLLAIGIPLYFLYRFHSQAWYWHVLALLAALAIGLIPTPPEWKTALLDLVFGSTMVLLLIWGIGGLVTPRVHREKHA
jgi:hypothetical protein